MRKTLGYVVLAAALVYPARSSAMPSAADMDAYFSPYVTTNNFSGSILIKRGGEIRFAKSYGYADSSQQTPNRLDTRFHVASLSILFTSTAVLRLIDQGELSFDTHVSDIVPGIPNDDKITIRELLEQNSGLPDVNDPLEEAHHDVAAAREAYARALLIDARDAVAASSLNRLHA